MQVDFTVEEVDGPTIELFESFLRSGAAMTIDVGFGLESLRIVEIGVKAEHIDATPMFATTKTTLVGRRSLAIRAVVVP